MPVKRGKMRDDFFPPVPWWFKLIWGASALICLSVVGVIVWAIIRVVTEFTG